MNEWDDTPALKRILEEVTTEMAGRLDADLSEKDVKAVFTALEKVQWRTRLETIAAEVVRHRQFFDSVMERIGAEVPEGVEIPEYRIERFLGDDINGPGPGGPPDMWAYLYAESEEG